MDNYFDIVNNAIELTIVTDEDTGWSYLEPRYKEVLRSNEVHLSGYEHNGDEKDEELWEILKLEVEKRNAQHNVAHAIAEWAYQILTQTVDPALVSEENELMQNIMDYLKLDAEVKDKRKELEKKEEKAENKESAKRIMPTGLSFAKKNNI